MKIIEVFGMILLSGGALLLTAIFGGGAVAGLGILWSGAPYKQGASSMVAALGLEASLLAATLLIPYALYLAWVRLYTGA